jgi:hypothetical protein
MVDRGRRKSTSPRAGLKVLDPARDSIVPGSILLVRRNPWSRKSPIDATLGRHPDRLQMDASTWKTVEQAFHDHAVLVFPGGST